MFMTITEVPRVEWKKQPIHYMAVYRGNTVFSPTGKKNKKNHFIKQMLCPPFKKQLSCLKEANVHTIFQHILSNLHFFKYTVLLSWMHQLLNVSGLLGMKRLTNVEQSAAELHTNNNSNK